jgi:hypothetical protein
MRELKFAALAAIVTFIGCVRSPPPAPVAEPAGDLPATAFEQPEPSATTAASIAEPIRDMPPIAVVEPTAPATMASPVTPPISEAPLIAVVEPTSPATPPSLVADRPAAAAPSLAQETTAATASSEPPAVLSRENATASAPDELVPPVAVTAPAEPPTAQEQLDLATLEQRLRETRAIGVFTKLSIKNQVDDLLDQFRGFYQGRLRVQLEELRERYELLLFKVLTLLQDADRELAEAITASREAIWGILTDPQTLERI